MRRRKSLLYRFLFFLPRNTWLWGTQGSSRCLESDSRLPLEFIWSRDQGGRADKLSSGLGCRPTPALAISRWRVCPPQHWLVEREGKDPLLSGSSALGCTHSLPLDTSAVITEPARAAAQLWNERHRWNAHLHIGLREAFRRSHQGGCVRGKLLCAARMGPLE